MIVTDGQRRKAVVYRDALLSRITNQPYPPWSRSSGRTKRSSQILNPNLDIGTFQGRNWGGVIAGGARPLLHFILWLRARLKIEAQHILHLDKGHALSYPSYYKYTCAPLSKLPSYSLGTFNILY